ncbi:hypothetical protein D1872_230710 [compost metagenome]
MRQLPDRRRFAYPVNSNEQEHRNTVFAKLKIIIFVSTQQFNQLLGKHRLKLRSIFNLAFFHFITQIIDQAKYCINPHIRTDQNFLQLLEEFLIDLFTPRNQFRNLLNKPFAAFLKPILELFCY